MTRKDIFGLIFFFGLMAYGIFGCDQPSVEKFDSNVLLEYRSDTATIVDLQTKSIAELLHQSSNIDIRQVYRYL